jgi:hypothetical protein
MIIFMIITAASALLAFTVAIVQHELRHQESERALQEVQEKYISSNS